MTNFEKLTATKPELARFLRSLPILEAPWDTEFQKRYCTNVLCRIATIARTKRSGTIRIGGLA